MEKVIKIYILSPTQKATGGTELLHQLSDLLIEMNYEVYMFYTSQYEGSAVQKVFKKYRVNIAHEIEDDAQNIVITPEMKTHIGMLYRFSFIKKVIWWLSVDNYLPSGREKVSFQQRMRNFASSMKLSIYGKDYFHCVQSEYARQYLVNERNISKSKIFPLSDYINETFITSICGVQVQKQNVVLYNPQKGYEFTKMIINQMPEVQFVPLVGLTSKEMSSLLQTAKVYIDFGNHPGKDRIPREAAMSGCCVITNRKGAAKNNIDVNIPERYKIETNNVGKAAVSDACDCIRFCLENYEKSVVDFIPYTRKIAEEKVIFQKEAEVFLQAMMEQVAL